MELVVAAVVGILGGGTLATIVRALLSARADNARTAAAGRKLEAEAFDVLVDQLQAEIGRLTAALTVARDHEATLLEENVQLKTGTADMIAKVRLARAEVTRLQDQLDALELRRRRRPAP